MASYRITVRENKTAARPKAKWVVDIAHPNGRRERRHFSTKKDAEAEAGAKRVEIENMGVRAMDLPFASKFRHWMAKLAVQMAGNGHRL